LIRKILQKASYVLSWIELIIGYLLSPLSWWNDAFINLPLSWFFASILALFYPEIFPYFMIFFYWLTNFAGILLMYVGGKKLLKYKKTNWKFIFLVSLAYTLIIIVLILFDIIKPIF
jgi:hypothetical protein